MSVDNLLVIKVRFQDDIRKVAIRNEDLTYDELIIMLERIFKGSFSATDDLVVKYLDEEDDLICISDTDDLLFAISSSKCYLKLNISLPKTEKMLVAHDKSLRRLKERAEGLKATVDNLVDEFNLAVSLADSDSRGSVQKVDVEEERNNQVQESHSVPLEKNEVPDLSHYDKVSHAVPFEQENRFVPDHGSGQLPPQGLNRAGMYDPPEMRALSQQRPTHPPIGFPSQPPMSSSSNYMPSRHISPGQDHPPYGSGNQTPRQHPSSFGAPQGPYIPGIASQRPQHPMPGVQYRPDSGDPRFPHNFSDQGPLYRPQAPPGASMQGVGVDPHQQLSPGSSRQIPPGQMYRNPQQYTPVQRYPPQ